VTICSVEASAIDEPLPGTAPFARAWIVIEHAAPWGRDALLDNRLPEAVRTHVGAAKAQGISVLLARHPDRPDRAGETTTNVWVARSGTGGLLLRHGVLDDVGPLARWDLAALASGSLPAIGSVVRGPLLLVCTHSRRDRCCAVHGRSLLNSILDVATPDERLRVWECSHVGGHRFAPVTVSLPSGAVHGRLADSQAAELLQATREGRVLPGRLRGRSALTGAEQAAEHAVRVAEGIHGVDDLDVLQVVGGRVVPAVSVAPGDQELEVRHRDGRTWRLTVVRQQLDGLRAESCGGEPIAAEAWRAGPVAPGLPWS
jgi:hypothetical protein